MRTSQQMERIRRGCPDRSVFTSSAFVHLVTQLLAISLTCACVRLQIFFVLDVWLTAWHHTKEERERERGCGFLRVVDNLQPVPFPKGQIRRRP